jgi:beta-lactam-binding protein with PASTA domain
MPDIVGKTQAEAESTIAAIGLVTSVKNAVSETVPVGNVISQTPAAGATVARGSTATLTISQGPAPVKVPNVVGKAQAQAESAITTAGLTVNATTSYSETVANGVVISQDPAANTSLARGTTVSIVVSMGRQPITVPNIIGRSQAEAQSAIEGAGLSFGGVTQQYYSDSVPSGAVISQEPAAGGSVQRGTSVSVVLSRGASQWVGYVDELPAGVSSATHEIQTKDQYRARTRETTTSSSSTMAGWTPDGQETNWGEYGDWSGWSTNDPGSTDSRQVESNYFAPQYATTHKYSRWVYYNGGWFASYTDNTGTANTNGHWENIELDNELSHLGNISGHDHYGEYVYGDQGQYLRKYWYNHTTGQKQTGGGYTEYRYRERSQSTVYKFYRYTEWSAWMDGTVSASDTQEKRVVYRYREK